MPKKQIARLMAGFRDFREKFFLGENSAYSRLSTAGQFPKTLIIACSDSRVDPAIIYSSEPGELFVVRNIASLVPPYEEGGMYHGVSAAIEFAVVNLKVEHVIILGHRQCGGMRALALPEDSQAGGFVKSWVSIAEPAKKRAIAAVGTDDSAALWRCCELESIKTSIDNLRTFPFIRDAEAKRGLHILGLYFDLEKGELLELNEATGQYTPVVV